MNATPTLAPLTTEPAGHDHATADLVARLQDSQVFRDYQQAFQTATGLPLVLRPVGAIDSPMTGVRNANPFCALMLGRSKTCASCLQFQASVEQSAATGAATVECAHGLNDSLVPVILGERVIAYLQTGQVLFRKPSEKRFETTAAQVKALNPEADVAELHTAFFGSRVISSACYQATIRLLASFARHLSLVANELMIARTKAEPPAIARARTFIAEHLGEEMSLEQVAHAASMSPYYFCKVFKATTGVTFTDYVARLRVEKTKQLLLNPNTRISEAAYEAGFQSLSQFNRVFRRVEGQSPTHYREHHHGTGRHDLPRPSLPFAA
jgi:AraC-like DNA-binding protein/ligand-binding sensor protein